MKGLKFQSDKGAALRKRTERFLSEKSEAHQMASTNDVHQLFHELSVYQTELEMQNEELRRAHMVIEESRSKYTELYDFAPVGYLTCNQKGLIAAANLTSASMLGVERRELIHKPFSLFVRPDYRNLLHAHYRRVFESNTKQTGELGLVKKDGSQFHVLMESIVVRDINGNPTNECMSVFNDVTERKRAEEEIRLLQEITMAITGATDFHAAMRIVLEKVCKATGWTYGEAWIPSHDKKHLAFGQAWYEHQENLEEFAEQSREYTFPPGVGLPGSVWSSKKPEWVTDVTARENFLRHKSVREFGLKAAMGIPVINGAVVAVLIFFVREQRDEDERLVKLISTVAIHLGTVLKNKWAEVIMRNHNEALKQHVAQGILELQEANNRMRMKIAEQKMAAKALRMSENRYRMLLESLPQSIFYKNNGFVYVSCNENYARYLNIRPDEIYGKTAFDLFPETVAKKFEEEDKMVLETGKVLEKEEKLVKDGKDVIMHTVKTPVRDEKGNIVGILGIFFDVTEKELLRMEALRTRQLASLGELAAGVAHEINNPINSIINYAQILSNKSHEGSKENDITIRIIKEGNRIANIVGSLLSFARVRDKKTEMKYVSVNTLLSETLALTGAQLRKDGIKIKLDMPQDLPEIYANEQMIQQVFFNIISNARYALNQKYPQKDEGKILEIAGEEIIVSDSPQVKITFYDRGMGIPADILDKIGEPFFTTKPRNRGTGLGVSISRGIISDHGGNFTIDSVEREYCKVVILLPVPEI